MSDQNADRFQNLDFEGFRQLAKDDRLSRYEKIGFPDSYRSGYEAQIFDDIVHKLDNLDKPNQLVMDIGPGCSDLPMMLIERCRQKGHSLILIDSAEMLAQLPNEPFLTKVSGFYPRDCAELLETYRSKLNVVLSYSVLQYLFVETNVFQVLDKTLSLLADGGQILLGDIPNISKRKRFFSSNMGKASHRDYTGGDEDPQITYNQPEPDKIDDSVVMSLLSRSRAAGYDAYVIPQASGLPMANRREDILITKP